MNIDWTNPTAPQVALIAVVVTLIAALVSATSSYAVAKVNHAATRRLAVDGAIRDFRLKQIQPLLTFVDTRSNSWTQLLLAFNRDHNQYKELLGVHLANLLGPNLPSYIPVVALDPIVERSFQRYFIADRAVHELLMQHEKGKQTFDAVMYYISAAHVPAAITLRYHISNYLFYGRSPMTLVLWERFGDWLERRADGYNYHPNMVGRVRGLMIPRTPSLRNFEAAISRSIEVITRDVWDRTDDG
jgi:hypothetical protein